VPAMERYRWQLFRKPLSRRNNGDFVSDNISDRQEDVNRKLEQAYDDLIDIEKEQKRVEAELKVLLTDRSRYSLLSEISDHLDQLYKQGGASLFWGEDLDDEKMRQHSQRLRSQIANYDNKVQELQALQSAGESEAQSIAARVNILNEESAELQQVAEEVKYEFVIERDMTELPFRPMVMPWQSGGEDEKRFRRIVAICLLIGLLLGYLIPLWDIPIPEKVEPIKVPERMAQLMLERKPPPPPPPPQPVKKTEEETPKDKHPKKAVEPTTEKARVARKRAESAGLMAFKKDFSELMNTGSVDKKLGAKASISSLGKTARHATRSLVTAEAGSSSSGINTASLSRDVGGAGTGMKGVAFQRVESAIGTDCAGGDRPLSSGPGPSRTDEEIQIVFDRNKAPLYRSYSRELRNDPTLRGQVVLRLTIEPDGSVSFCEVERSDMNAPALEQEIVNRVLTFDFGAKEGITAITILYPIDFLPAG
jgi:outer membrane biosynthesis protein TonB